MEWGGAISEQSLKDEAVDFFITGNGTVWFLMTLFLAESLFVYIKSLKRDWITIGLAFILVYIPDLLTNEHPLLIVLNRFFSAYFYIVVGYYFVKLLKNKKVSAVCSILLVTLWLWLVYNASWEYSFFNGHFSNIAATVPTILCGGLGFIALLNLISCSMPAIEYVGRNSLILMLVHPTFLLIGIWCICIFC